MSRFKGTFIFGANLEGASTVPIDARQLVGTYADLTNAATWCFSPVCSTQAIYDGMLTVVSSDPTPANNGAYWLCDASNYTSAGSWIKVGGGGVSNLTGATNGLSLVNGGTCVALGGTLTGDTIVTLANNDFKLRTDVTDCGVANFALKTTYASSAFNICSNGGSGIGWSLAGNSTSISAYHCANASNNSLFEIKNSGITLSNNTSSELRKVTLNNDALVYGSCYSTGFTSTCSLVDKGYVDTSISATSNVLLYRLVGAEYYTQRYDDIIGVSGISSNQIYLYPTPVQGQRLSVVDVCGNALADPIIINGYGKTINGGVCATVNTDFGSVTFIYNGVFWSAVAFVN